MKISNKTFALVSSIACYKCSSINGSNPLCEDIFQGDMEETTPLFHNPCLTNLRGRQGLFPATHCIKLVAYSSGIDKSFCLFLYI